MPAQGIIGLRYSLEYCPEEKALITSFTFGSSPTYVGDPRPTYPNDGSCSLVEEIEHVARPGEIAKRVHRNIGRGHD